MPCKKSNESLAKRFNYALTCKLHILYLSTRSIFNLLISLPPKITISYYQMEQGEHNAQSLSICYRIYHFIMKTLVSQAMKTVTLGGSKQFDSTKIQNCRDDKVVVEQETKEKNIEEKIATKAKAPRKTVSINENVEEIDDGKKRKKRCKSFQKSNSLERQQEENEDIKPLRPILKVKSNLDEKSI